MNLGCGAVALLLAFILGAGALLVAVPTGEPADATAGPVMEASPQP